jgi:DNA-binding NarL/FixJ family response regulator
MPCSSTRPEGPQPTEDALAEIPHLAPEVVLMDMNLPNESGVQGVWRSKDLLLSIHIHMLMVDES